MAENMVLQAISFKQQAALLQTRVLLDMMTLPFAGDRVQDMHRTAMQHFESLHGFLFNHRIDVARVEARFSFAEMVKKYLNAGMLGRRPKNLRPDLKLSIDEANTRKAAGEDIPEWYIRTPQEEEIVVRMKEEYKRRNPSLVKEE